MGEQKPKKRLGGKVQFKHETEANWELSNYIPDKGEQVLYDPDEQIEHTRIKFGNGKDKVKDLPFSAETDLTGYATEDYVDKAVSEVDLDISIEKGDEDLSLQQTGSRAISKGATAFGENNFAGLKSFEILGWDLSNGTYTLSSALPEEIPVGAEFGIQVKLIYYRHGTITAISEDRLTVTVDNYVDIQAQIDKEIDKGNDPNIVKRFWFTDYPTVGDTDEGAYAFAAGANNLATHYAATALGIDNKTLGKYGTTFGKQNEAHYAAIAGGYNTKALGEEAVALGYNSTANAHRSVVIGQGLNSTVNDQIVIGKFNAPVDDAIFIVGNGTGNKAKSNALTIGFDGQIDITYEPTKDTSAINKKYVDTIEASIDTKVDEFDNKLDTFQDRLANIEAGFITIDTDDGAIELPKMSEDEIIISKIGGNTVEGINKIAPENIITGGATNGLGAQYTISGNDIIVTYANTTAGMFAIGIDIDVKPNTVYRLAFNRVESESSIGSVYCYTDNLWGTSVNIYSPSKGTTKNTINFTEDYLTFDSGDNNHLVLGLYSNKNRTSLTDVISNLILTEGEDEVAYVPYQLLPCKTTSVKTYTASSSLVATYTVPSTIQNLPGYGHTDSVVDFMSLTYSYRTTDGKNFSTLPTVISIADIITEAPRITAESEGIVQFVNNQSADVYGAILYQKETTRQDGQLILDPSTQIHDSRTYYQTNANIYKTGSIDRYFQGDATGGSELCYFGVKIVSVDNSFESFYTNVEIYSDCTGSTGANISDQIPASEYKYYQCIIETEDKTQDIFDFFEWQEITEEFSLNNIIVGGLNNTISNNSTLLFGNNLKSTEDNSVVFGKFNTQETDKYLTIGGGTDNNNRKNIFTVSKDGVVSATGTPYYQNDLINVKYLRNQIVNNLNSQSSRMALSAYQGKVLNDKINNIKIPTDYATKEEVNNLMEVSKETNEQGYYTESKKIKVGGDGHTTANLSLDAETEFYNSSAQLTAGRPKITLTSDESIINDYNILLSIKDISGHNPSVKLEHKEFPDSPTESYFSIYNVDSATVNGKEIATEEYVTNAIASALGVIENGTY